MKIGFFIDSDTTGCEFVCVHERFSEEVEPDTAALRERRDGGYQGGHVSVNDRLGDWCIPLPVLIAKEKEANGRNKV